MLPGIAMAEGVFIHSYNEISGRCAILGKVGKTGVLYLSEEGSQKPVKDAFTYMQDSPVDKETWKENMKAGEPSALNTEIASETTVIPVAKDNELLLLWENNGQAVALLFKGKAIAFISLNEKYGLSKAVTKESSIVNPWNQGLYEQLFKK